MSIELLPPDPVCPKGQYHVRKNYCQCHPETCCYNDWAVFEPSDEKHTSHFHRDVTETFAKLLNREMEQQT